MRFWQQPGASLGETARARAQMAVLVIAAALAANIAFVIAARLLGADFPYSRFLFMQEDRFADFFKLVLTLDEPAARPSLIDWPFQPHLEALRQQGVALQGTIINADHLPPLAMALALAARRTIDHVDIVLLFLGVLAALGFAFFRVIRTSAVTRDLAGYWSLALILSFPLILAVDRGHVFSLICGLCLVGAILRMIERGKPDAVTFLLLAIAINIRPNVIVLPALFFCSRQIGCWRDMAILLGAVVAVFGLGLLASKVMDAEFTLQTWRRGLDDFRQFRGAWPHVSGLQSSLSTIPELLGMARPPAQAIAFGMAYAIGMTALILAWRGRLGRVEMVFLALAAMPIGLPDFADYHLLVFVLVPMLFAKLGPVPKTGETIAFAASLFVLVPKAYIFGEPWFGAPWSSQTIANPLALLAASLAILWLAMRQPAGGRTAAQAQPA